MKKGTTGVLTCSVQDYKGKTATIRVTKVPVAKATIANAYKIAEFVVSRCNARIVGCGATIDVIGDDPTAGKYDRVLQSLRMLFSDNKGGTSRSFSIPAPKDSFVNDDQEPHSDLPEDVRDLLKTVGAIADKGELTYNGGGLNSRLPRAGARSTVTTGV